MNADRLNEIRSEGLCEKCGREYPVWFAPNEVWNNAIRGGNQGNPDEWAFLCPVCFMFIAEAHGVEVTAWVVSDRTDDHERHAAECYVLRAALDAAEARATRLETALRKITGGNWNFGNEQPGLTVMDFARSVLADLAAEEKT